MKRLIASILAAAMLIALCACGAKNENDAENSADVVDPEKETLEEVQPDTENTEDQAENEPAAPSEEDKDSAAANKDTGKTESKPASKPNNNKNNSSNKSEGGLKVEGQGGLTVESGEGIVIEGEALEIVPVTPENNTQSAPESKPESKPQASGTVAQALLSAFKSKVSSNPSISAQELGDALLSNSVIKFSGGTVPVEPGMLTGFDNAEIKGFSEGVMFAPMIGTIPFVGYVFTLESGTDAQAFVSTLKSSANPRWNICTEAEETVAEASGNKVFFVMAPKTFEE